MKFQEVKSNIVSILSAAEAGRYITVGSQKQSKGATENENLPRVVVFLQSDSFPKSSSNYQVNKQSEADFVIEFTVIEFTEVDLSVLNNPAATPAQLSAALSAAKVASDRADDAMDQVFSDVWNVIMDALNYDLGLPVGEVTDRFIDSFQKGDVLKEGQYVALSAQCRLTCNINEEVNGDTGTPIVSNDTTINIDEDQGDNMGVVNTP